MTRVSRNKHVIRWVQNTPDGRKRKSRTIHGTYREACLELDRLHVLHADERPCPTVGKAAELWWLPWLDGGAVKESTRKQYLSAWQKHVEPRWSGVPLDAVKPADVQEWLSTMGGGAAAMALSVARKIGDMAVKYEAAPVNKFRISYEMPKSKTVSHPRGILTQQRARAVWDGLRGTRIEAPFLLMCFGGLRVGESLAVRTDDLTFSTVENVSIAAVSVSAQMGAGGYEPTKRGDLKNPQSVRTACIPGGYAARLLEIRDARIADGSQWICDRGDGLPLNVSALQRDWREYGAPVELRALRASWRTMVWNDWRLDYDAAELLMGHALPGVTGRHYLRPTDEMLCAALARAYAENGADWEK